LTLMMAQITNLEPGEFVHTLGDAHLYKNHIEQTKTQLSRTPLKLPTIEINKAVKNIDEFTFDDFKVIDYEHHPHIKAPISV